MNETLGNFFYPEEMFSSGLETLILDSLPFEVVNHVFCLLNGCALQT